MKSVPLEFKSSLVTMQNFCDPLDVGGTKGGVTEGGLMI
jgi:hypothetical protein